MPMVAPTGEVLEEEPLVPMQVRVEEVLLLVVLVILFSIRVIRPISRVVIDSL